MRRFLLGLAAAGGLAAAAPAADPCPPVRVAPLYCPPVVSPLVPPLDPATGLPVSPPAGDPTGSLSTLTTPPGVGDPAADGSQFARGTERGGVAPSSFNENFGGDFAGVTYTRTTAVGFRTERQVVGTREEVTLDPSGNKVVTLVPVFGDVRVADRRAVRLLLGSRYNGVKITDNDSPRPVDRAYFGYNYYDRVNASLNPGLGAVHLHRETMGFEKTVLGGDASFGLRLPYIQQTGPGSTGGNVVGDLSVLVKYAVVNDRTTGDVLSAGLMVTTPTGGDFADPFFADGSRAPRSVLLQPWVGFVKNLPRAYTQAISSLIVPTDSRDPTLFNNSFAVGYRLYDNRFDRLFTAVIPTVEVHVRTPLNHRDPAGAVYLQDQVNLTSGVHFRTTRATLSPMISVPLVGPRPWNLEVMVLFNFWF